MGLRLVLFRSRSRWYVRARVWMSVGVYVCGCVYVCVCVCMYVYGEYSIAALLMDVVYSNFLR